MNTPHRVAVLAPEGAYPFDLGIASRVLGAAAGLYEIVTFSTDGGPVRTNADFSISVEHGPEALDTADTVIVPPFTTTDIDPRAVADIAAVLSRVRPGTRLVSICTGAFVLAAAGLLDGRPATTHWALADLFRAWYPNVALDADALFIDDGDVLTSAGATSGIDVCLQLVRVDHGEVIANRVARMCVAAPWRDGGQAQFIEPTFADAGAPGTRAAQRWALDHLDEPMGLDDLARQAKMSRRTFARRFSDEIGVSPGRWLIQQRVNRARRLLETTDLGIDEIAAQVGFGGASSLREHLQTAIGVTPQAYRRTFRTRTTRGVDAMAGD